MKIYQIEASNETQLSGWMDRQMDGETDRKTSRVTNNMWAGRQKDGQTKRQTD
jgi:hypothetical protein